MFKWNAYSFLMAYGPGEAKNPVSILYKSIAVRYRPVSCPDGPITARYRFIKNASWENALEHSQNADLEHLAHAQSIMRAFALRSYILQYPRILLADIEGPDQTVRMRRLSWAFAVRICLKTRFRIARPSYNIT